MTNPELPKISGGVLVVGDVMEDIIVQPEGPMALGSDVRAKIEILPGGSGANQAVWLGASGVDVRFLARVGQGDLDVLRTSFKEHNVRPLLAGDTALATGRLVTMVAADGERSFFTDRAANVALSPKDCPADILDNIGLLHVSGYAFFEPGPREAVQYLGDLARRHNIPVSVDPASTGFLREVGAKQFLDWTEGAAICFPNLEEAALLSGASDPLEQVTILGAHYGIVVVKCGAAGAVAGNENGIIARVPAPKIEAIDSTGAGDAFFAGFIVALTEGAPLEHCLLRGNQQGGDAASRVGGRPE